MLEFVLTRVYELCLTSPFCPGYNLLPGFGKVRQLLT